VATTVPTEWPAYLRPDGRKGIRNLVAVVYLVECAHHVSREIAAPYGDRGVHVVGFPGCYPSDYAFRMLSRLCTHPNVGAALLVSLGCESLPRDDLHALIADSGRPVQTLVIQDRGGTRSTVEAGRAWVETQLALLADAVQTSMSIDELTIGTICGGSDGTSGLTANPAVGRAFDRLVADGATCIFEETVEMVGCEDDLAERAVTPELGAELREAVLKAERYSIAMGYPSFAAGNATGGLTTIEEKSLGAYSKSGRGPIQGLIKPGDIPECSGLFLLDVVPDGVARWGFPNINDNAEIAELIKVCANPETFERLGEDMDVDAGRILYGQGTLDAVAEDICGLIGEVAAGRLSVSESLGHREFVLGYKSFEPIGPACHPASLAMAGR